MLSHLVMFDSLWPLWASLPGSSIHGISQARILEGLPFPSPEGLPNPEMEPASPALTGGFSTAEPPGKPCPLAYSVLSCSHRITKPDVLNVRLCNLSLPAFRVRTVFPLMAFLAEMESVTLSRVLSQRPHGEHTEVWPDDSSRVTDSTRSRNQAVVISVWAPAQMSKSQRLFRKGTMSLSD